MKRFFAKLLPIILCLNLLTACSYFIIQDTDKNEADIFRKKKKYTEAIQAYKKHIKARLSVKNRPEWDNPYIYLLDIGDIYLEQENHKKALKLYNQARKKKVKLSYINDRYRTLAMWFEKKGDLKAAIEILKKYQDTDELLMDLMLDRYAKALVEKEESELLNKK